MDCKRIAAYAAKMEPKRDYPTVSIGSVLGGLCYGSYLAKQRIPVTVVEQENELGGFIGYLKREIL